MLILEPNQNGGASFIDEHLNSTILWWQVEGNDDTADRRRAEM